MVGTDNNATSPYQAATLLSVVADSVRGAAMATAGLIRAGVDWFAGSYRERPQSPVSPNLRMYEAEPGPVAERSMPLWHTF